MRTYFANLSRPKRTASAIQDIFPLASHSQSLEWSAKIYGYRDWNELTLVTKRGDHPPTPDESEMTEEQSEALLDSRIESLASVLNLDYFNDIVLFGFLNTHKREAPVKRLFASDFPKGGSGRFFQVIQADLDFPNPERGNNDSPVPDELDHSNRSAYERIPHWFEGGEEAFLAYLCKKIEKFKDGKAAADMLRWYFKDDDYQPGPPQFSFDDVGEDDRPRVIGSQTWTKRLYVFDQDKVPSGLVIWTTSVHACQDDDDHNELSVLIHDAWAAPRDHETWTGFSTAIGTDLAVIMDLLTKAFYLPSTEASMKLEIGFESESEALLSSSHKILEDIRDLFSDQTEIPAEHIAISYYE